MELCSTGIWFRIRSSRFPGWPAFILLVAGFYLAAVSAVFAMWQLTGNDAWIIYFFRGPGALLQVLLAGVGCWLSIQAFSEFAPGEPMRAAWLLISVSAVFDLSAAISVQLLGAEGPWNFLARIPSISEATIQTLRSAGLVVGGPFRFATLCAGLVRVLGIYRRAGFPGRLALFDRLILVALAVYVSREFCEVAIVTSMGKRFPALDMLLWPVDPLLAVLLAAGMMLSRSVRQTGMGLIGKCWGCFSLGILLTLLGDVAIWATNWGYLPWPWSTFGWCIWLPASAAFALAPAYQVEAIHLASSHRVRPSLAGHVPAPPPAVSSS